MIQSSELRRRARASLGMNIFGSLWLLSVLATLIVSAMLGAASYVVVGVLIISGPLSVGLATVRLRLARGEGRVDLGDLFLGFTRDFTGNLLIGLVIAVKTFLWTLLLVVPGIVKSYSYSMSYYVKCDHPEYTYRECIAESQRIMMGNKGRLFWLDLSYIGWGIVGALCLGVGTLWVQTWVDQAHAEFYESLREVNGTIE